MFCVCTLCVVCVVLCACVVCIVYFVCVVCVLCVLCVVCVVRVCCVCIVYCVCCVSQDKTVHKYHDPNTTLMKNIHNSSIRLALKIVLTLSLCKFLSWE